MSDSNKNWVPVCDAVELQPMLGVRALLENEQVAIFRVQDQLYALNAIDPFSNAAVLSRGIVGSLKDQIVVASPLYKQHFNLATGVCLEDDTVSVKTYAVREEGGKIQLATN
ncbi:nitrite reductase small subunit NirD [Teredinibacter turnerae]|uniref:Nitrite reductase [NAD(P)H], small subunit n=1 Tax=Teredinibacter turnerae (strain ATCC 39867 / T7901) TaxID=377629 RepID=C6AR31_TERTT|nr:nitrite reductase small subunit NirD [Teredinibacter turnerae]ACS93575.1 nitrite reductase [NAD(P)H], small subunit [Teredinibacter turnerae T7901]